MTTPINGDISWMTDDGKCAEITALRAQLEHEKNIHEDTEMRLSAELVKAQKTMQAIANGRNKLIDGWKRDEDAWKAERAAAQARVDGLERKLEAGTDEMVYAAGIIKTARARIAELAKLKARDQNFTTQNAAIVQLWEAIEHRNDHIMKQAECILKQTKRIAELEAWKATDLAQQIPYVEAVADLAKAEKLIAELSAKVRERDAGHQIGRAHV